MVTGAASGVGAAVAHHLARGGARVACLDIDERGAAATAESIARQGGTSVAVPVDVGHRPAVAAAYEKVRADLGPIHVLVTSAAVSGFDSYESITPEGWDRMLRVNLSGTFHCTQLALPDMVAAGWGRIVTVSSAAGQAGSERQGHYAASKGGVIALTKTIAIEYAGRGITANSVPPFMVDTPLFRQAQSDGHIPPDKYLTRMVPAGRLGVPDDIATTCAFLCSDAAGYLTGQVIGVNGGAITA